MRYYRCRRNIQYHLCWARLKAICRRSYFKGTKLGRHYWGRHLWSRGYCVSTAGLDEEMIRKYVRWQEKKEKEIESQQFKLFQ